MDAVLDLVEKMRTPIGIITTIFVIVVSRAIFVVTPLWRICRRAGFSGAISIIAVIPYGDLLVGAILGLANWPARASHLEEK